MIDDKELNTLLSSYNPTLSENTEFLRSLEKKLHAIDVVMDYKAKETRHYRRHAVLCFLAGALMGIFLTLFSLLFPSPMEIILQTLSPYVPLLLLTNIPFFVFTASILLAVYGVFTLLKTQESDCCQ